VIGPAGLPGQTDEIAGVARVRGPVGIHAAQTLAWLAVQPVVAQYANWHREQAGGYNNGCRNMLGFAKALCGAETGWLRQHPELALTLPEEVRPADWAASCDAVVAYCTRLTKRDKTGKVVLLQRSRNPFDGHLSWFLSFDDPMDPIVQAVTTLRLEAAALATDSRLRAARIRDAALLALLLMLPIRAHTASRLRWGTHIWQVDNRLIVQIPPELLKNGQALGTLRTELDGPLVAVLLQYVAEARPVLLAGRVSTFMFLSGNVHNSKPWGSLSGCCVRVTERLCDGHGLPEQEFRHLVATRYLRTRPGDYVGVAHLLWDTLETVVSTYAPADPTRAVARNASSINLSPTMKRQGLPKE